MDNVFSDTTYKRSRAAYMAQCTEEHLVSLLVADAFLAKLLSHIGMSDSMIGIISSFATLAFLFQLLSLILVQKINDTKKTVIFFNSISQFLFMFIFAVPFLPCARAIKTLIVIFCVLTAFASKFLVIGVYFKWANSFVEPTKRGEYSAVKEMISLLTGIVFSLAVGYIMDIFERSGNIKGSFLFLTIILFILNIFNLIFFMLIAKDKTNFKSNGKNISLGVVIKKTLGNRNFINVIILETLWNIGIYSSVGFMGVFKTNDLLMSVGTVQLINTLGHLLRFAISKPLGRFSDRTSYATGIKIALIIAAVGFGINIFTTKETWWCIVIFTILYNMSHAGIGQNMYNITYSYVESDYIVQAMAIKSSIAGVLGFVASLISGKILSYVQINGNMLFGISMYGQQLLSIISFVFVIAAAIFTHKVVSKQKVMIQ